MSRMQKTIEMKTLSTKSKFKNFTTTENLQQNQPKLILTLSFDCFLIFLNIFRNHVYIFSSHHFPVLRRKKTKETSVQLQHAEEKTQKFISTDQETVMQHEMSATISHPKLDTRREDRWPVLTRGLLPS